MSDFDGRTRHPIDETFIEVLGGRFQIKELLLEPDQTPMVLIEKITSIEPDRWFVVLAEEEGTSEDVLALIDDQFEFESVGIGTLLSE